MAPALVTWRWQESRAWGAAPGETEGVRSCACPHFLGEKGAGKGGLHRFGVHCAWKPAELCPAPLKGLSGPTEALRTGAGRPWQQAVLGAFVSGLVLGGVVCVGSKPCDLGLCTSTVCSSPAICISGARTGGFVGARCCAN